MRLFFFARWRESKAPGWAAAPPSSDSRKLGGGDGVDGSVDAIGKEAAA
jgi:hypothetical protein